jgi:hypothetical protein
MKFQISKFEKSLKSLFKFILVWPQFKFGLKVFETSGFKSKSLVFEKIQISFRIFKTCFSLF